MIEWHSQPMPQFHGTIDDLKAGVEATGIDGEWAEKPNACWKFTAHDRAGLNWSENKGTLSSASDLVKPTIAA
jgi:hypothetical protein